jgi:hypothetical protein
MGTKKLLSYSPLLLLILYPIYIHAQPESKFPTVNDQAYQTEENAHLKINLTGTSGNTTHKGLKFSTTVSPINGILFSIKNVTSNLATVVYKPKPNFTGPDSFEYKATNGIYQSNKGTISITVNPPNAALILKWNPEDRAKLAFIISAVIVFVIFFLTYLAMRQLRRGKELKPRFRDIMRDENWYPSLAIFQFLLWTGIVLFTYFGTYLLRLFSGFPTILGMPPYLLEVMGISAAVPVISGFVSRVKYGGVTPVTQSPTKQVPSEEIRKRLPGFMSMLMENGKITLIRFQMFAWTWISIIVYISVLFSQTTRMLGDIQDLAIVDINILFVTLMGLSQGTYVINKASTSDVFSINEIRPCKVELKKDNLIYIIGSNFGEEKERGTIWIEYYRPLSEDEKNAKGFGDIENLKEARYKRERLKNQFKPEISSWGDNRIIVKLDDETKTKLDQQLIAVEATIIDEYSVKKTEFDDSQRNPSKYTERLEAIKDNYKTSFCLANNAECVIRVEKSGLLTYANSDATFYVIKPS